MAATTAYVPSTYRKYQDSIRAELYQEFAYSSIMQVPRLEKVVLSMGVGDAIANKKAIDNAQNELSLIAGQRAVRTKAKRSIANFKLREGMEIGVKVTLRRAKMWESTPTGSTATATTRSESPSTSSFRRSTTTRSRRSPG